MLIGTRNSLERARNQVAAAKEVQASFEKQLADVEQAIVDYCTANGVLQFSTEHHSITMGSSESVDVPDAEGVPEEFTRVVTKREADKVKIKNTRPQGNWYAITEKQFITLRSKNV
jgi:hypothetical protein